MFKEINEMNCDINVRGSYLFYFNELKIHNTVFLFKTIPYPQLSRYMSLDFENFENFSACNCSNVSDLV
jgi:hypothetical protein